MSTSGRKKDPIWNYYNEKTDGKWTKAECKQCSKQMQGLVDRMKKHLKICPKFLETTESGENQGIRLSI